MEKLGRLERIDARTVWTHEAHHFTPWLHQNIGLLAEALGVEIEATWSEVAVGDFAIDLVGKTVPNGRLVIAENQRFTNRPWACGPAADVHRGARRGDHRLVPGSRDRSNRVRKIAGSMSAQLRRPTCSITNRSSRSTGTLPRRGVACARGRVFRFFPVVQVTGRRNDIGRPRSIRSRDLPRFCPGWAPGSVTDGDRRLHLLGAASILRSDPGLPWMRTPGDPVMDRPRRDQGTRSVPRYVTGG